jgi:hypothetical protein
MEKAIATVLNFTPAEITSIQVGERGCLSPVRPTPKLIPRRPAGEAQAAARLVLVAPHQRILSSPALLLVSLTAAPGAAKPGQIPD